MDIFEEILDWLFDILGWILPLIGKFWLLIAGYLGYKFLGKGKKKAAQSMPRRELTPVAGSFPADEPKQPETVRASAKYEPIEPESLEGVGFEQEWAFAEPTEPEPDHSVHLKEVAPALEPTGQHQKQAVDADPREGMKWALIFGQPRSKAPFAPPYIEKRTQ